MENNENAILVFTGDIISIQRVKAELEANGISCFIKDAYKQGIEAGFVGGTPSTIDLFVLESDVEAAMEIIKAVTDSE
jgi:hypothetical protein